VVLSEITEGSIVSATGDDDMCRLHVDLPTLPANPDGVREFVGSLSWELTQQDGSCGLMHPATFVDSYLLDGVRFLLPVGCPNSKWQVDPA
jgi:hypothetical protein